MCDVLHWCLGADSDKNLYLYDPSLCLSSLHIPSCPPPPNYQHIPRSLEMVYWGALTHEILVVRLLLRLACSRYGYACTMLSDEEIKYSYLIFLKLFTHSRVVLNWLANCMVWCLVMQFDFFYEITFQFFLDSFQWRSSEPLKLVEDDSRKKRTD